MTFVGIRYEIYMWKETLHHRGVGDANKYMVVNNFLGA